VRAVAGDNRISHPAGRGTRGRRRNARRGAWPVAHLARCPGLPPR